MCARRDIYTCYATGETLQLRRSRLLAVLLTNLSPPLSQIVFARAHVIHYSEFMCDFIATLCVYKERMQE